MMIFFKKAIAAVISASIFCSAFPVLALAEGGNIAAFPGAEGGGMYTTGARGKRAVEVYHVTNLNDRGAGSLRDAVSKSGRIVVFDVGGVIELKSKLNFGASDITVLGQTAPGDGITLTGYDAEISADNIIIRYLKIRPTDDSGGEPDGIGGRWVHNIILDHCSMSWSVDELLTLYAGSLESNRNVSKNITVQYCLASESLRMSNHIKGAHGYGGIVGGTNATYHHNLFAHHDSRSPRFDRNLVSTDFVNNVIYDWGNTNSMYGGEPYSYNASSAFSKPEYVSNINIRNNYLKYGPSTKPANRSRIFEVTNDGSGKYNGEILKSNLYINGNYVYGYKAATANNTASTNYVRNKNMANILSEAVDMAGYDIDMQTAEEAYATVLDNAGATLPKRDEIDARIAADVKNGTGRIVNTDEEAGGLAWIKEEARVFEIPGEWKNQSGMDNAKETDIAPDGYTWIEKYVNEWTDEQNKTAPTNPDITVMSPAVADMNSSYDKVGNMGIWEVTDVNTPINYSAVASEKGDTYITKMELWDSAELIREYDGSDYIDDDIALSTGAHYLMSKAYNNLGECTQSPVSIVYVTGEESSSVKEIGNVPYPDKSSVWVENGKTYIAGSGLISNRSDACSFYHFLTNGDFEFSCRVEDLPKYENSTQAGIMFRETLDPDSRMIMVSDLWRKYGENIQIARRLEKNGEADFVWLNDVNGEEIANSSNYDSERYALPKYLKISRTGGTLTVSVSDDGEDWTNNVRQPMEFDISEWSDKGYIGLAVDSVNGDAKDVAHPPLAWFTIASFSDIKMVGAEKPKTPCVKISAEYNDDGSLKTVTSIEDTYAEDAGEPALSGTSRVFIWETLDNMKPIKSGLRKDD